MKGLIDPATATADEIQRGIDEAKRIAETAANFPTPRETALRARLDKLFTVIDRSGIWTMSERATAVMAEERAHREREAGHE